MSHVELDELFRKSPPGEMPDGRMKGTFIVACIPEMPAI
jgi:hypothetical protein